MLDKAVVHDVLEAALSTGGISPNSSWKIT
jgi:hypothetical protein